jgi:adenine-specific DNA-methyltransferase
VTAPASALSPGPSRHFDEALLATQLRVARGVEPLRPAVAPLRVAASWNSDVDAVLFNGDCEALMQSMPDASVHLIVSSPPYNIGKSYEKKSPLGTYIEWQKRVLRECDRVLVPGGSICWQVGNYIDKKTGEVIPLDALFWPILHDLGLLSRNRIIWTFEHGLHATRRFSGRHESILWFSKGPDAYFNVDPIRVGQKYPNKRYFKGPRKGELSGNPRGKNPGDVWNIPNVKHNHPEKTEHPCSFPIELAERFVLSMSSPGDVVLDPFGGVGSTVVAAALHGRIGVMAEIDEKYITIAEERLARATNGTLLARPMGKPIYGAGSVR